MKTLVTLSLLLAALALQAQNYFSSASTLVSSNVAYSVAPAGAKVKLLSAWGELLPYLSIYNTAATATVTNAGSAGTNSIYASGVGNFVIGDVAVIYDVSAGTYQRALIWQTNSATMWITNDLTAGTVTAALTPGDKVYKMSRAAYAPIITTATTTWTGDLIWYAADGPSLFQVKDLGTPTTNQFCIVAGER